MALRTEREKAAHILRRFGLGASEAELDYYLRNGLSGAIDELFTTEPDPVPEITLEAIADDRGIVRMPQAVAAWVARMVITQRPLREKMTLFWHDHFATSGSKVTNAPLMFAQNELLRTHALGSFRGMLQDVAKDPAMLLWLDNQENVRGKPNENFAREVMELFTLGVDQGYTEKDVQEAARAFTGWAFRREAPVEEGAVRQGAVFLFRPRLHDEDEKVVLGHQGNLNGEDVINLLCERPRTAEYLTTKIWEWFVYPNPSPQTIAPFAKKYFDSGLDTAVLVRAIIESPEFYSERAERAIVKTPVDFCVATLRQLGYGGIVVEQMKSMAEEKEQGIRRRRAFAIPSVAANSMKSMGMSLMFPPDVAGWEIGAGWISSATMVERMQWSDRVFGTGGSGKPSLRYQAATLFEADPSAPGIVKSLLSVFDAELKPERVQVLVDAVQKVLDGEGRERDKANLAALAASRLIFASPDFQFA